MSEGGLNVNQIFWLLLTAFVVALAARRFKVPYALALVVTGLVIGLGGLLPRVRFDPTVLLTVFLPPLLFESAINLPIRELRRNWMPITIYTLAGTVLSTFLIGALTAWMLHLALPAALVFGALISTTDPISVIAVFKRLGADKRLKLIMEAESLFNNDTAVVLFAVMMSVTLGGAVSVGAGVWQFFRLMLGGAALGLAVGAVASRLHYELDDHLIEITLTTVVAFGSYIAAETLRVSGVMAVVVAGLVIGNFGMPNTMSAGTRLAVAAFWEYAGFVVNSLVFLLIGIAVVQVDWKYHAGLALGTIVIVLIGRAAIYPLSRLINWLHGDIPLAWQHILFWGGLRGALSMALALGLPQTFPQRDTLIEATFGVVLFSLLAQGFTIGPLLTRLGLTQSAATHQEPRDQLRLAGEIVACRAALLELERMRAREAHPNWSVELLMEQYRARLRWLEETLEALEPEHRVLDERQAAEARRLALLAEKGALQEAQRQGMLDEEDWQQLSARLDSELIALQSHPHEA